MVSMKLARLLRHGFITPRAVDRWFPAAALQRIAAAIAQAEAAHSGEIRFAVEAALPWSYLRRDAPVRQRAVMVFSKLRVWDTEHNNGVLIYVELADHGVEIVADRGIARHVPRERWEAVCNTLREHFRRGQFEAGVIAGVQEVGALLTQHFPLAEGERNPNELSNKPAVL
jgi:uncharacterized membrane protein